MKLTADHLISQIWSIFDDLLDSTASDRAQIISQLHTIATESCSALAMSSYFADNEKRQLAGKETSWPLLVPADNRKEAQRWLVQVLDDLRLGEDVGFDVHRITRSNKDPSRISFATFLFRVLNHKRHQLAWENLPDHHKESYEYLGNVWNMTPEIAYSKWREQQAVGQSVLNESSDSQNGAQPVRCNGFLDQ